MDESLSSRLAKELRSRGRASRGLKELGFGGKDPEMLRALFGHMPEVVLVTGDDDMPGEHAEVIKEVRATIATVEPWDRRPRPAPPMLDLPAEESWKREVVHRWSHAMAGQPLRSIRRYGNRPGEWRPRVRPPQTRLFS